MGEGAQHKLSLKYTYTDTHAIANHNALDDHTYSLSYTENTLGEILLIVTLSLIKIMILEIAL